MKTYNWINRLSAIIIAVSLVACGGGGGGNAPSQNYSDSTSVTSNNPYTGSTPADSSSTSTSDIQPKITGFDFNLQQGDFWEYKWDNVNKIYDPDTNSTTTTSGRFRITLGTPRVINGITAYKVIFSGSSTYEKTSDFYNPWQYLALQGNKLYGSKDGSTLVVIFDAVNGYWPGSGVFFNFDPQTLMTATPKSISNNYINGSVLSVAESYEKNRCENYSSIGLGTICAGNKDVNYVREEYYRPGIGLVGGYYHSYTYYDSQSFPGSYTTDRHIGLVASSFTGDTTSDDLEIEPNDSEAQAQALSLDRPMVGYIKEEDPGKYDVQVEANSDNPNQIVADWYTFTLSSDQNVSISLNFDDGRPADLDLYLFDRDGIRYKASLNDNVNLNSYQENISNLDLQAGTYYIGIQAWSTSQNTEYTLKASSNNVVKLNGVNLSSTSAN